MPVRGRPRNPLHQSPLRFHETARVFVAYPSQTPGLEQWDLRAGTLAAGTVRRLWRQQIRAPHRAPVPVAVSEEPFRPTVALRYLARSVYVGTGTTDSRFSALHTVIAKHSRQPIPTRGAGSHADRPTVRNRMVSFGSRVEPLNPRARAAAA